MARMIRQLDDEALERPFNKSQFTRLLGYMKPYIKKIALALVLMVIAMGCSLAAPFIQSRVINELDKSVMDYVPWLLLGMVVLAGIGALCTRGRIRLMENAGRRAIAHLREDLFHHIQSMSFSFFDTRSAGKLLVRVINDVNSINNMFTNGIVNMLIECITMVLLLVIMFLVNWKLTLIAMCILPILVFVIFKLRIMMRKRWQKVRVKSSTMNGYLHESLAGMRVTEAFVRENENADTYNQVSREYRSLWNKAIVPSYLFWPALDVTGTIGTILVYIAGVNFMQVGSLNLADLLLMLWYLGRFWQPLNTLSTFYNDLLSVMASVERIFEIMDTEADIQDKDTAQPLPPLKAGSPLIMLPSPMMAKRSS